MDRLDDLRRHLQWAIELEHAMIPPYLLLPYPHPLPHGDRCVHVNLVPFGELHFRTGGGEIMPVPVPGTAPWPPLSHGGRVAVRSDLRVRPVT